MAEGTQASWYCLSCSTRNTSTASTCRACGIGRDSGGPRWRGVAFLLNELASLHERGQIDAPTYDRLRERYEGELAVPSAGQGATAPAAAARPPAPPTIKRTREGPGWLAEQQANLLLYLGAFLMVIAALIVVGYSEGTASNNAKMALMLGGTVFFLGAGYACLGRPRVRQSGVVFFAVGALMVPLDVVGAYGLFFADSDINPAGLWLGGSLICVLFYGAVAFIGVGRWYAFPTVIAVLNALGAILVLADAPPEAYPGSFMALAVLLALPYLLPFGKVSDTFGAVGFGAAQVIVALGLLAALAMSPYGNANFEGLDRMTRWYLPPTVLLAALFYWMHALRPVRIDQSVFTIAALGISGGALISLVYALDVGNQWYGPAVAVAGGLYAAGSEGVGPRWFGQRHLTWMALATITGAWFLFEGVYAEFPKHGVGVHFAAAAMYGSAAWLWRRELPPSLRTEGVPPGVLATVALLYAGALTAGIGFFFLLSSVPGAEVTQASDVSMAFFGVSLAVVALAATARWWWAEVRLHIYAIALVMSLFVLLSSVEVDGRVTVLLTVYATIALALTLWERQAPALWVPAVYGFFALLAAWRLYEPRDEYLPLALSAIAYALFATRVALRDRGAAVKLENLADWSLNIEGIAFAYGVAAPVAGWVRLAVLADDRGFIGVDHFEETVLYQVAAASVLLLGAMVIAHWWFAQRRIEIAVGASALLMVALLLEIGHFRPENVQAYTAPLGAYLLCGGLLALRVRDLPADFEGVIGLVEVVGAGLIMGPSFLQSFDDGAWGYGLLVLGEGLVGVALALVQRRLWLLGTSITFVVLNGVHYLFFRGGGGPGIPTWAILAMAGALIMAAGTAILVSRERWTAWQEMVLAWWSRQPPQSRAV